MIILKDLYDYFNCGSIVIDNRRANAFKFQVNKRDDLINFIIPHFNKYPLVGSKQLDFLDWKKAILLFKNSVDINSVDIKSIITIKENMNSKRSFEERWNYLNSTIIALKNEWVQAFVDGEGCFQCGIGEHKNRDKTRLAITNTLEIAQNTHDVKVLESIRLFFGKGYLKPKYDITSLDECKKVRSVSRYIVYGESSIIKFFDKHSMFTRKHLDYLDWKDLIALKEDKAYKTKKGIDSMIYIKKGMNTGRLMSNSLISNSGKLNIFRWSEIQNNKRYYHTNNKRLFIKGRNFHVPSKRTFTYSIKVHSLFTDWPYINYMIDDVRNRENSGETLWECDYSFITSGILPYYFHTSRNTQWVITPEYNYLEGNHPDYTIFNINTNPYKSEIYAVVEVKSKTGDSWNKLLEQMYGQANVAKQDDGKLWTIGQKGLEICIFRFDVGSYEDQKPDVFTNYEPLNLSNLNNVQLDQLDVKYEYCDDNGWARIALIKWRLDDNRHKPYIDHMFQYIRSRKP